MSVGIIPLWIDLLSQRGLSEQTIGHFDIAPRGEGWHYPIHPAIEARRWKAFDSTSAPKYLWLPAKPQQVRFYNCDGRLADAVTAAEGDLWLACGEADVWALWEGGIPSATCLFDGEARKIPAWFIAELESLGVRMLHLVPDRDRAGTRFVINVSRALAETCIRIVVHRLPYPPRSKADIGRLLQDIGAAELEPALRALPVFETEFVPAQVTRRPRMRQLRLPNFLPNDHKHYRVWSVDVVEAAAVQAWGFSAPDSKGFSRNFHCPFHDDQHPSAGWSYRSHGVHCFACGYHGTREVAAKLGVISWPAFKSAANDPRGGS